MSWRKLGFVSVVCSIAGSLIYLFGGSFWGGIVLGAVAGLLVTAAFPKLIGYIRNQRIAAAPDHFPVGHILSIVCLTSVLTLVMVSSFQAYSPRVERLTNVSLVGDGDRYGMRSVEWDGQRYVAVGWHQPPGNGSGSQDAALWESPDAYTWKRIRHDQDLFGSRQLSDGKFSRVGMTAIRSTDNGALVFGFDSGPDGLAKGKVWRLRGGKETLERPSDIAFPEAIWYSSYEHHGSQDVLVGGNDDNVLTWKRENNGAWSPTSVGPRDQVDIFSVRYLDGQWVMAGFDRSADPDFQKTRSGDDTEYMTDGSIWTSEDGVHWEQAEGLAGANGAQAIHDVIYTNGMWIAVGEDDFGDSQQMDAAVWSSEDGKRWRKEADRTLSGAAGWQTMLGATLVDGKIVVVGRETPPDVSTNNATSDANAPLKSTNAVWTIELARRNGARSPEAVFWRAVHGVRDLFQ